MGAVHSSVSLINQYVYHLNPSRSKSIAIGLDLQLVPVLKIFGKNQFIVLNVNDWNGFMDNEGIILNFYYNKETPTSTWLPIIVGSVTITFVLINQEKVIKLIDSRDNEIYLALKSFESLKSLKDLIKYRLELMIENDFKNFYHNILKTAKSIIGDPHINLENVLAANLRKSKHENGYVMLEFSKYFSQQVHNDLEQMVMETTRLM